MKLVLNCYMPYEFIVYSELKNVKFPIIIDDPDMFTFDADDTLMVKKEAFETLEGFTRSFFERYYFEPETKNRSKYGLMFKFVKD